MKFRRSWFAALLFSFAAAFAAAADLPPSGLRTLEESDPERDARVAWHKEARFGCFVHWGVYSRLGNEYDGREGGTYAEHIMRVLKIPRAEYLEKVAKPFRRNSTPTPSHAAARAKLGYVHSQGQPTLPACLRLAGRRQAAHHRFENRSARSAGAQCFRKTERSSCERR